jgi:PKD repeat protein
MKKFTLVALSLLILNITFSQTIQRVLDKDNMRDGETVEYCSQHKRMQELLKDPAMMEIYLQEQQNEALNKSKGNTTKGVIYKIPIVFHVLHNNGIENISDEQIMDALFILNRDYRKQNADTANVQTDFQGMPGDVEIEFVLATKAPNGACFKGITRTANALSFDGSDGGDQVAAIIAGNDVYNGTWPGNRYLNVFIVAEAGGAAGYTMKPAFGGTGMGNGIWILHNYVGSIGTSDVGRSRALTHEAGHWLNLDHTWGGNNNPGNASSCSTDDNVTDTPNCIGVTSCALNANTCNSVNAFWTYDVKDNVENYMDYSYCSKMFTPGQVTRMRNAITSSSGGRNNLHTVTNLNQTGATGVLTLCKADFAADRSTICAGETVNFFDDTYNAATGWSWTFTSGSPATSTAQNPSVTYTTPGLYTVELSSTDGTTTDVETKTAYIRVLPASATIPFLESFESYSTLDNLTQWEIYNPGNNNKFSLETTTGHTGTKCAKLVNFGQVAGGTDELISSPVDLSGVSSVTLSFRYAYRKRATANIEYLKVFLTKDCGENWVQRKTLSGNSFSSIVSSTTWAPTSQADWVTVHMTNVTSDYWVDDFRYKFRFESDGGNNFYLDDINIYAGSPSDELVAGIAEEGEIAELALFPNPTDGEVNVRFAVNNNEAAVLTVQDISGKVVKSHMVNALAGSNLVILDTQELAAGSYFLNIRVAGVQKTLQFIVK